MLAIFKQKVFEFEDLVYIPQLLYVKYRIWYEDCDYF